MKNHLHKVEAYTGDIRACLNFLCISCLCAAVDDGYKIKIIGRVCLLEGTPYWCDNCGKGDEHPKYKEAMERNINRKGELV